MDRTGNLGSRLRPALERNSKWMTLELAPLVVLTLIAVVAIDLNLVAND
jgi:hypothetical protein